VRSDASFNKDKLVERITTRRPTKQRRSQELIRK
jgi:hypothetical protein